MQNYFDLGKHTHPITTDAAEAQIWFDRGLIWCYGFNHEEAICCFQKALEFDPDCAMAFWGIAYACGPFYNKPWEFFGENELIEAVVICNEAIQNASARMQPTTPLEQALIQALMNRFPSNQVVSQEEFNQWDDSYARGMKKVYDAFPNNLDVIALYAEAMMTRTPWKLWDVNKGMPAKDADTVNIIQVLEKGLDLLEAKELTHAGIYHMYIHALEMSPYPEKGLRAADPLRGLVPDSGHLLHMPSHIDVLCGHYENALTVSKQAILADKKYLDRVGKHNFYTTSCCHDFHLMMYAAMLSGQYKAALFAANGIIKLLSEDVLRIDMPHMACTLEGYYAMKMHVLIRFGKWVEIIAATLPSDSQLYCVTTAMFHYAKGIAYAATGEIEAAEDEKVHFHTACENVPPTRLIFNNQARDILAVGAKMLAGELAYRKENYEEAFNFLRQAASLDDNLFYTEPWAWMHPPRHALGALLLEQNRVDEAAAVYQADLGFDDTLNRPSKHPNNVWSLHGFVECLSQQNKTEELVILKPLLDQALVLADVDIHASCFCRLHHDCC